MADAVPVPPPSERDLERFYKKVAKLDEGCWEWVGARFTQGYGMFYLGGRPRRAHRVLYCWLRGEPGLPLDHLCNHRWCVNPDHLEPRTIKENVLRGEGPTAENARKEFCVNGHQLDYIDPRGWRGCRICRREAVARYNRNKHLRGV